jgi:hypothetical protein
MPDELRDEIGAALRELSDGEGATIKAVRAHRVLVTLECAIGEATGGGRTPARLDEIAAAVVRFLEAAADSLEPDKKPSAAVPNEAMAARAALGLKPELKGKPWIASRGRAGRQLPTAEWLDMDKTRLDKRLADGTTARGHLLERMAEHLSLRDSEFVAETRRLAQRARRPPLESAMRIDWLARFEFYYKMWGPASGLRHDLELALHHHKRVEVAAAELFTRKSLYYYAKYLAELKHFEDERGGLWILPNTKTENAIADSSWLIRKTSPLTEVDESMLCVALAEFPELALFIHATFTEPYLQPIVNPWRDWIYACQCARPRHPRKDCKIHKTIKWAALYMDALDAQWDFLADWYHLPRPGSAVDPLKFVEGDIPDAPSSELTE